MTSAPMMQPAGRPASYPPQHAGSKAKYIAGQFLHQYYNVLQFRSKLLDRFYRDDSVLTVAGLPSLSEDEAPVLGTAAIGARAAELFTNAKVLKEREDTDGYLVDAQEVTTEMGKTSSILLHAFGGMEIGGETYRFFQTFFLAPQTEPVGYYVKHDILRFIKEARPVPAPAVAAVRRPPSENGYAMVTPGYHAGHHAEAHLSQPVQAPVYIPAPSAPLQHTAYTAEVPTKASLPVSAPGHNQPRPGHFPPVPPVQQQQPHLPMHSVPPQPPAAHAPLAHAPPAAVAPALAVAPPAAPKPAPVHPAAPAVVSAAPVAQPAAAPAVVPAVPAPAPAAPAPAEAIPPAASAPSSADAQEEQVPQNLSYAERLRRSVQQPKSGAPAAVVPLPAAAPSAAALKPAAPVQAAVTVPVPAKPAAPAAPAGPAAVPAPAPAAAPAAVPVAAPTEDAAPAAAAEPGSDDQDESTSTTAETNCSVFVKTIPDGMSKDEVVQIFSKFGPIKGGSNGVNLFMSKSFPGTRMAYIDYENSAGPEAAMAQEVDIAGTKVQVEMKRSSGRGTGRHRGGYPGRGRYGGGRLPDDGRRSYDGGRGGDRGRIPNGGYKGPRGGGAGRPDGDRPMRDGMEGGRGGRGGGRGRSDFGGRGGRGMGRGGEGAPPPREPRGPPPSKPTEA